VIALQAYGDGLVYYPVSTRIVLGEFCPSDHFIHSLGRDFAVLLDMNVVVGLKGADFVIRELNPVNQSAKDEMEVQDMVRT
jgi:hypothetical protein